MRSGRACAGLRSQEIRQPFDTPLSLLRQRHRFAHRPPRPGVVPQRLEGPAEPGRRREGAEAAHRGVPLLDPPVVLLQPVVQVLAAAMLDPLPAASRMARE